MPILILDGGRGGGARHADALTRLGFLAVVATDWRPAIDELEPVAVVAEADLFASLGDLRRVRPGLPFLIACDAATADDAVLALDYDAVGFVGSGGDLAYAIALASLRLDRPAAAREEDSGYALRLAALGEEIARIARAIEPPEPAPRTAPVPDAPMTFDPAPVRAVLKARRLRDSLFPAGTFADPAWDMLLDLTASRAEGRPVSVTSLAIAAAVPTTTALRHLKGMADAGMIDRRPDPGDGRRIHIGLTEDTFARMRAWVAGLAKAV